MHKAKPFFMLALLFVLTSCLTYKDVEFDGIEDVSVDKFGKDGIELTLKARVKNPNNYAINIADTDLTLSLNGKELGEAVLMDNVRLKKKSDEVQSVRVKAKFDKGSGGILGVIMSVMTGGQAKISVKGEVKAKAFMVAKKVPVEFTENIKL